MSGWMTWMYVRLYLALLERGEADLCRSHWNTISYVHNIWLRGLLVAFLIQVDSRVCAHYSVRLGRIKAQSCQDELAISFVKIFSPFCAYSLTSTPFGF